MSSPGACSAAAAALLLATVLVSPAAAGAEAPFAPLPLLYGGRAAETVASVSAADGELEARLASALRHAERTAFQDAGEPAAARSPRRALFYSLLLPGMGELYLGHRGRATGFFIAEGGIWANFAVWRLAGHLRKNDYIEQAQLGAGLRTGSEGDDYWRLVGQYESSSGTGPDAYEETLRREARLQYPDDPAAQDRYVAERLPVGDRAWNWSTPELQAFYRGTRQNANRAYSRSRYSFGFAVLNRLLSALDTQILYRSSRHRDAQGRAEAPETRILTALTADGGGALLIQRRF